MKNEKKKKRFRDRMIMDNLIIIIMAIVLIELCLTAILVNSLIEDNRKSNYELVQTMSNSFDDMWNSFKWTINSITMEESFQEALDGDRGIIYEYGEDKLILGTVVTDASLYSDELDKVYIYDKYGESKVKFNRINQGERFDYFPELAVDKLDSTGKITTYVEDGRLTFARIIYSLQGFEKIGYISCIYDESALTKRINTVVPSNNRFVMVLDHNGDIITHNHTNTSDVMVNFGNLSARIEEQAELFMAPDMGMVLVSIHESSITRWSTVSVIALKDILIAYKDAFLVIGVVGVLAAILCFLVQLSLVKRITRPLDEMVHSIALANEGNYTDMVSTDTDYELSVLAQTYNHLMRRTDILVNQVLKGEIAYKEAQMVALQAQVNPHLLFNTLECINWLSEYGRKDDIRTVTTAFSKLMKGLLSKQQMVSLGQELELTESFLRIYKIMLGDKLAYSVECSDVSREMNLPRLTIQPLVENAVIHGIKPNGGGHVDVVVAEAMEGIIISIIDDGMGMQFEKVEAVNAYASGHAIEEQKGKIGLGFCNVIDRIHLLYGQEASLEVSSNQEWGTMIRLILPEEPVEDEGYLGNRGGEVL